MSTTYFETAYNSLNPEQKLAVDTIDGPVLVVAGPGTGKTQVLAARIANILLKTDTAPQNILALTFTESAAKNMRQRVVKMIGQAGYYVQITTFHSFCSGIIASYPEYFPIDRNSQALSDVERFSLIEDCINDLPLDVLKPINRTYFYVKDILKAISDLKREGITLDEYEKIIEQELSTMPDGLKKTQQQQFEKKQKKNQELLLLYKEYEERLRESLRFDFDDMIGLVVHAFKHNEELLLQYQEKLQYILVDEYQDTNSAQNQVVTLLASFWGEDANIFAVGDPHQSIYRFQGASVENIFGFIRTYPTATVITLAIGYRAPQGVYTAAHHLIENNNLSAQTQDPLATQLLTAVSQSLKSNSKIISKPKIFSAPSQQLELVQVAYEIQSLLDHGTSTSEIAVLYRTNAESIGIQEILDLWGIAYDVDGSSNVLDHQIIIELLNLLRVIVDLRAGGDGTLLFEVLSYPWLGLSSPVLYKITRAAGVNRTSIYQLLKKGYDGYIDTDGTTAVTQEEFDQFVGTINKIEGWGQRDLHEIFPEWFQSVASESGLLSWMQLQQNKLELLLDYNAVFNEIKKFTRSDATLKCSDFIERIEVMKEHGLQIRAEDLNVTEGAIQLATVHKAKGREWEYVFIVHCIDGRWGNRRKITLLPLPDSVLKFSDVSKKEQNEDERRLFYVALTRAKKQVMCSYPDSIVAENKSQSTIASMFLHEIADFTETIDAKSLAFVDKEQEFLEKIATPKLNKYSLDADIAFYEELVNDFKLSVTALNDYLRDPEFFVTYRLLRVPQAKPAFLAYGSAIHAALEKLFRSYMQHQSFIDKDGLLDSFEKALRKELLLPEEFTKRLSKGSDVLDLYYEHIQDAIYAPAFLERSFGNGFSQTILGDIHLLGRIDRIDWVNPAAKTVKVIDYKTGKVKSAREIEGLTVSANLSPREQALPEGIRGPYKRQLLFYKLLSQLDKSFSPEVTHGSFEFLEPSETAQKFITREFELPQSEVELLKELIILVMKEIRELEFLK